MSGLLALVAVAAVVAVAASSGKKAKAGSGSSTSKRTIIVRGTGRSGHLGLCDFEIVKLSTGAYTARWLIRDLKEQGLLDAMSTDSAAFLEMSSVLQFVSTPPFSTIAEGDGFAGGWGATVHWEVTRDAEGLWGWNATRTGPLAMEAGRYPYIWLPMFEQRAAAEASLQTELSIIELGSGPTPPPSGGLQSSGPGVLSPRPGTSIPPYIAQPGPPPNLPPPLFSVERWPNTQGVPLPGLTRSDGIVFSTNCQVAGVGPRFWDALGDAVELMVGRGFEFDDIMTEVDTTLFSGINIATCLGPRLLRREIENRLNNFLRAHTP